MNPDAQPNPDEERLRLWKKVQEYMASPAAAKQFAEGFVSSGGIVAGYQAQQVAYRHPLSPCPDDDLHYWTPTTTAHTEQCYLCGMLRHSTVDAVAEFLADESEPERTCIWCGKLCDDLTELGVHEENCGS